MNTILVSGFWDHSREIDIVADVLKENGIQNVNAINYLEYKKFGKTLNRKTFFNIMDDASGSNTSENIYIGFSMGAGFLYDYLSKNDISPHKVIMINPFLRRINDVFTESYFRLLDMYNQDQIMVNISDPVNGLSFMEVALYQVLYNRSIDFTKKIEGTASFIWSKKDMICKIKNYETYKKLFNKSSLVTVPDEYHNWIVKKGLITKYILPELLTSK